MYAFLIVAIIPGILFFLLNAMIFSHVRSSTQRVAPSTNVGHVSSTKTRDMRLIKSMSIIFSLFVIGWGPVYILVTFYEQFVLPFEVLKYLAESILFSDIVNLYVYNTDIRLYLKQRLLNFINIRINNRV